MSENIVRIYGTPSELEDMENFMSNEGFKVHQDTALEASQPSGESVKFIEWIISNAVARCIVKFLEVRGKRMVSRTRATHYWVWHYANTAGMNVDFNL